MNRLAGSTSPYLRQHAENPVDWHPFGEEAFALARDLDRPLFVSIGYAACHWCHVMAHESFEDEATAALINANFVPVKVDREERPDVDALYMEAVQALSGHGGWPMSVFTTPEGKPFFAGTYYPKRDLHGMPSFTAVLTAVSQAWEVRRGEIIAQADELTEVVGRRLGPAPRGGEADLPALRTGAVDRLVAIFDPEEGGFGTAPKFPQPLLLDLLARAHLRGDARALPILEVTLAAMASGGIYDHLAGGFSRYSVDRTWTVPHFEKMLCDQALLARVYLHAWQLTGDAVYRQVLEETVGFVLSGLRDPAGGLHSSIDADSEGEEGRFYLWTRDELDDVLGPDLAAVAAEWYGVTAGGNFEGRNILVRAVRGDLLRPPEVEAARRALLEHRASRVAPGVDDKVLVEWNAMFASALAEAAGVTGNSAWTTAAVEIVEFLLEHLRRPDGRLLRSWQRGRQGPHLAVAADYAWLLEATTRLAELTGEARWIHEARDLADSLVGLFADPTTGGLRTVGSDAPPLVVAAHDLLDQTTPAASSVGALGLARLGALLGDPALDARAVAAASGAGAGLQSAPTAFPELLSALEVTQGGAIEVVVAGERPDLLAAARAIFEPARVLCWGERSESPLWEGRVDGLAYVCERGTCLAPVDNTDALAASLAASAGSR